MKNKELKIALAQVNPLVGDIGGNTGKVIALAHQARSEGGVDLVMFPELALTGYPPEDLLLRPSIRTRVEHALEQLLRELPVDISVLVGYPRSVNGKLYNAAGFFREGKLVAEYHKQELPNYQVFDEKRYFSEGRAPCIVEVGGVQAAITICEDMWHAGPMAQAREAGAQLMLNINASPFHEGKGKERQEMLGQRAREGGMPLVYMNMVGGQDELVFDGASAVVDRQGEMAFRAPAFTEGLFSVTMELHNGGPVPTSQSVAPDQSVEASIYDALVLGVRDYVNKNGFTGAVLGLSGGIDSALTLAVAVDALGSERVEAVMMPFRYTSQMSLDDAARESEVLSVNYHIKPIQPMYDAFMESLATDFADARRDTTEENLQARCRGVLLMALSNKKGYIVLTTGNKSEMAVGYATLYGDMAGGFGALKDVSKTMVYRLAEYRNSFAGPAPIPQRVIDRPPSAELAPDQKDEDSLPPYDALDRILELYIEQDYSAANIIAEGFSEEVVRKVIRLVDLNEYKRRQAAVGVRISSRAFGRDRRYPITCCWPPGE